jgi:methionyl-tRNA formyltransferase
MNILFLTNSNANNKEELVDFIKMYGDNVAVYHNKIDLVFVKERKINFIVSDRYSHIVPSEVLDYVNGRAINTHASMLPLNKGVQPNFFAILNGDASGVSIHYMDSGLDTGSIIIQKELIFSDNDTLRTSHYILRRTMVSLFCSNWDSIKNNDIASLSQVGNSSMNYQSEFDDYFVKCTNGWDTRLKDIKSIF